MKHRFVSALGAVALSVFLVFAATPAGATTRHADRTDWSRGMEWHGGRPVAAQLSLVHGVPDLPVDIYIVKNFRSVKTLKNVQFGTAADLNTALPGFVTPGIYFIDIVPAGAKALPPLLSTWLWLTPGQSKSVVAYVTADASGKAGAPKLGVFSNDVRSTSGQSRVTVRHLAVAPTVGVYANGTVPITPAFSNGQTASAVVPAASYAVTVTAPNNPSTVLFNVGTVPLAPNTNTLAFAIGTFPTSFKVVAIAVPTAH
jgi:hypothetical protein